MKLWASVAKWLAHLPFTSEAAGSSLSENFLNATRTQSSCERVTVNALPKVVGFSGVTTMGSDRENPGATNPNGPNGGPRA
jgi:hypothetical protein